MNDVFEFFFTNQFTPYLYDPIFGITSYFKEYEDMHFIGDRGLTVTLNKDNQPTYIETLFIRN